MKEHEFNNSAAWAKGWYKRRPNIKAWWMDLAHCINNDGWSCIYTKTAVVNWILGRFDEDTEWWRKGFSNFGFSDMYDFIHKCKHSYNEYENLNLSTEDCIILYFKNCLFSKYYACFTGGYKPSEEVLPLIIYNEVTNSVSDMTKLTDSISYALDNIDKEFPDLTKQKTDKYSSYEFIESNLKGAHYTDIQIPVGSDTKADFTKIYTGETLNKAEANPIKFTNENGDEVFLDLGLFSGCIEYDNTKNYSAHIETTKDCYGDVCYTVKNITEA